MAARNGIPLEQQPVIDVLDGYEQPVPQVRVLAAMASGDGTLNGTTTVVSDASGRATYTDLALVGPGGPRTLRFSVVDPALEVVSGTIIVGAGAPAQLAGNPPLVYQGTVTSPVSPPPSVVVKDGAGNTVPGITVTFEANRDATVSPETVVTDGSGMAQVTSWTLGSSASATYTLTARVEGSALPAVRFSATASAGAAGRLAIISQPSSPTQNGVPFSQQPVIQVTDQDGNPAPQANVQITATVSSGPNGDVQNATAMTDATGKATFSGLALIGTLGNYAISFSAAGLTGVTSNPITLTVGPPARLAVAVLPPATARSREVLTPQPVIQLQDAGGNSVAQAGVAIVASVDGGATLGVETTATTGADGRASFTGLAISGSPGLKTVSFNGPGLQGASAPVTLPPVASIVLVTGAPATAEVGSTLLSVPVWVLKDFAGNPVADAPFTLAALAGGAPAGSVVPVSGTTDGNGTAQVQTWTLGTAAGDQVVELVATGTALSSQVTVNATPGAAATLLKISGDNPVQSAPPDSALQDPFVVQVTDQFGNGVSGVTVQWRGCDGSGTYDPVTDVAGKSSARQPTGPTPGTYCSRATSGSLVGSPVEFSYTVTPASSPSMLRSGRGVSTPQALPPGPPRSQRVRPSPSR